MALFIKTLKDAKAALQRGQPGVAANILDAHLISEHNLNSEINVLIRTLTGFQSEIIAAQNFADARDVDSAVSFINRAEHTLVAIRRCIGAIEHLVKEEE